MIRRGSCERLIHENCDVLISLDSKYCKESDYCFPVDNFSVIPFGNLVAATATALDLFDKKVCVCDKGGCGRSGTVEAMVYAFLHRSYNFAALKKYLRSEYGLLRECPEKVEQFEAIKVAWAAFHNFDEQGFRLLTKINYVYLKKPTPTEEAGAFVIEVAKGSFLPFLVIGKKVPYGKEVKIKMNEDELEKVGGPLSSIVLEEYKASWKEGKVKKLSEVELEGVVPYALSFAALESLAFKTLNVEAVLRLLTKALLGP